MSKARGPPLYILEQLFWGFPVTQERELVVFRLFPHFGVRRLCEPHTQTPLGPPSSRASRIPPRKNRNGGGWRIRDDARRRRARPRGDRAGGGVRAAARDLPHRLHRGRRHLGGASPLDGVADHVRRAPAHTRGGAAGRAGVRGARRSGGSAWRSWNPTSSISAPRRCRTSPGPRRPARGVSIERQAGPSPLARAAHRLRRRARGGARGGARAAESRAERFSRCAPWAAAPPTTPPSPPSAWARPPADWRRAQSAAAMLGSPAEDAALAALAAEAAGEGGWRRPRSRPSSATRDDDDASSALGWSPALGSPASCAFGSPDSRAGLTPANPRHRARRPPEEEPKWLLEAGAYLDKTATPSRDLTGVLRSARRLGLGRCAEDARRSGLVATVRRRWRRHDGGGGGGGPSPCLSREWREPPAQPAAEVRAHLLVRLAAAGDEHGRGFASTEFRQWQRSGGGRRRLRRPGERCGGGRRPVAASAAVEQSAARTRRRRWAARGC